METQKKKQFAPKIEVFNAFKKPFSDEKKQLADKEAEKVAACCACTACTACR